MDVMYLQTSEERARCMRESANTKIAPSGIQSDEVANIIFLLAKNRMKAHHQHHTPSSVCAHLCFSATIQTDIFVNSEKYSLN